MSSACTGLFLPLHGGGLAIFAVFVVKCLQKLRKEGLATEQQSYEQRGYLHENFRLFHLTDAMEERLDWHYHTFHKLIIFLSGRCSYGVEGRSYSLTPGDLVLVPQGCIHRPEAEPGAPYERVILYISPQYLQSRSTPDCDLERCFQLARQRFSFVVRSARSRRELVSMAQAMEQAAGPGFGRELMQESCFLQFLIRVTRGMEESALDYAEPAACDGKTAAILQYLSENLTQEISIDDLSARFYVSKYHMMRVFRAQTGYTIHAYLTGKRLLLARELIASGTPVMDACLRSGFRDYSAFCRAYRKEFSAPPGSAK